MKLAIIVLAGREGPEAQGRLVNALTTAQEAREADDEVKVVFDGAGTQWPPALEDSDHSYHGKWRDAKELVAGVCGYCADAYGVARDNELADMPLLDEYEGHPSIRGLVADGWQVLTF